MDHIRSRQSSFRTYFLYSHYQHIISKLKRWIFTSFVNNFLLNILISKSSYWYIFTFTKSVKVIQNSKLSQFFTSWCKSIKTRKSTRSRSPNNNKRDYSGPGFRFLLWGTFFFCFCEHPNHHHSHNYEPHQLPYIFLSQISGLYFIFFAS